MNIIKVIDFTVFSKPESAIWDTMKVTDFEEISKFSDFGINRSLWNKSYQFLKLSRTTVTFKGLVAITPATSDSAMDKSC